MQYNSNGHNCHGVTTVTFMGRPDRDRWRDVRDFFPQSTELRMGQTLQAVHAYSLGYFQKKKRPPGFCSSQICQHPRWLPGIPGRWVCARCGSATVRKPVPGQFVVLEEDERRHRANVDLLKQVRSAEAASKPRPARRTPKAQKPSRPSLPRHEYGFEFFKAVNDGTALFMDILYWGQPTPWLRFGGWSGQCRMRVRHGDNLWRVWEFILPEGLLRARFRPAQTGSQRLRAVEQIVIGDAYAAQRWATHKTFTGPEADFFFDSPKVRSVAEWVAWAQGRSASRAELWKVLGQLNWRLRFEGGETAYAHDIKAERYEHH